MTSRLAWVAILVALAVLCDLLIADIIYFIQTLIHSSSGLKKLHYWIQILCGNWSDQDAYPSDSFTYCIVISTALLLNLGPPAAILTYLVKMARFMVEQQMERAMKWGQAIAEKEGTLKQALYNEFGDDEETITRIETAFRNGQEAWRPQLSAIFGRQVVKTFFAALNGNVPGPG